MVKTGQIRRCQGLEKLVRHIVGMRDPQNIFFMNCIASWKFIKSSSIYRNIMSQTKCRIINLTLLHCTALPIFHYLLKFLFT